jgi:hypothetical protein
VTGKFRTALAASLVALVAASAAGSAKAAVHMDNGGSFDMGFSYGWP